MSTDSVLYPKPQYLKKYVNVRVDFNDEGIMRPRSIVWTDGHEYAIDRVKDIRSAPALKAGGQGDRYTVVVAGKERFLFFEHNADYGNERIGRWFVEVKNPDYGE